MSARKVKRLKRLLKEIRETWKENDTVDTWEAVAWLVLKQVEEMKDWDFDDYTCKKECADILIIILRFLDKKKIDIEPMIKWRLTTRHKGKTAEIRRKYEKMARKEGLAKI